MRIEISPKAFEFNPMRISDWFIVCINLASLIAEAGIAGLVSASIDGAADRKAPECDISPGPSAIRGAVVAGLDTGVFNAVCEFG
ncbi:MAG: hypothetical protein ABR976_05160 [Terracidiphilus sp.]